MTSEAPKGRKRKLDDEQGPDLRETVARKLHRDVREVKKAAKKAKTFETQRVVKRLKSLRKDQKNIDVSQLEEMLDALKFLDHEAIATTALKSKLSKDKTLSRNEDLRSAMELELAQIPPPPIPAGSASAKMHARLLSSKLLSSEISSVVHNIHVMLDPAPPAPETPGDHAEQPKSKKTRTSASVVKNFSSSNQDTANLESSAPSTNNEDIFDHSEESGWESGTVGDDEREADDGWESHSIVFGDGDDMVEDGSLSEGSGDLEKTSDATRRSDLLAKAKAVGGQTTFLPSLSVGFVRGSGDSDLSDVDSDAGTKKNRRGQRARQAIWAKKYGRNANHRKREREVAEKRRERRQARSADIGSRFSNQTQRPSTLRDQQSNNPNRSHESVSKPLHPSWEAKKKQKATDHGGAIIPSAGKKIVFS